MALKVGGPGGGLTVISCDHEGCVQRFNSYSVASIVPVQAQHAKWTVQETRRARVKFTQHFCPKHKPRSVMQQSHPEVADKRSAAVAKARR